MMYKTIQSKMLIVIIPKFIKRLSKLLGVCLKFGG